MKCQACQTAHAQVYCQESQAALCKGCCYMMGDITRYRLCALCECNPARVFCHNDNAALCEACDADIHMSNPLAVRHDRVPLGPLTADVAKVNAGHISAEAPLESQHFTRNRRVAPSHVFWGGLAKIRSVKQSLGYLGVQLVESCVVSAGSPAWAKH